MMNIFMHKTTLFFFSLALVLGAFLLAQNSAFALDKDTTLSRIEKRINSAKTMEAGIIQSTKGEPDLTGHMYVSKPNKMRLYYDDKPALLVADGYNIIFYEKDIDQLSYIDLEESPAFFVLKEDFTFNDERIEITDFWEEDDDIYVTVAMKKDALAGKITLVFDGKMYELKGWTVKDARGIMTKVWLVDTMYNQPLDEALFTFDKDAESSPSTTQKSGITQRTYTEDL